MEIFFLKQVAIFRMLGRKKERLHIWQRDKKKHFFKELGYCVTRGFRGEVRIDWKFGLANLMGKIKASQFLMEEEIC